MSALALDRQAIEKTFPTSRRGYEPGAVDAHLATLATEVARLQEELDGAERAAVGVASASRGPSLSTAASEQVQVIVAAAERSAGEIERAAAEESQRVRAEATEQSRSHVARVAAATTAMLERVDAMEDELGALFETVRTGTTRLTTELSALHGRLEELRDAPGDEPAAHEAPVTVVQEAALEVLPRDAHVDDPAATVAEAVASAEPEEAPPVAVQAEAPDAVREPVTPVVLPRRAPAARATPRPPRQAPEADVEGARLIALSMALDGQTREQTDAYLGEHFDLADRGTLLDEVYASVSG